MQSECHEITGAKGDGLACKFIFSSFIIHFFFGAFPNSFGRYNSAFFASSFAAARTAVAISIV